MDNVFIKLHSYYPQASASEKDIIDYVLNNTDEVINMTTRELGEKSFTSPSTIVRLCRKMRFEGFLDFKNALVYSNALKELNEEDIVKDVSCEDSITDIIEKITMRNIVSLQNGARLLDGEDILKTADLIQKANFINLFGLGASLLVAKDALLKFIRINKKCSVNEDWHTQRVSARNMDENDLAIIFSYSGKTLEMIEISKELVKRKVTIVLITGFPNSKLASYANIILPVSSIEHIYRSGAMSSRMSQMNIVDILYITCIIENYEDSLENISRTFIEKEDN